MRRAARRDGNEDEIVDALETLGFHVQPLSQPGVPDLLVSRAGRWYVLEIKSTRGRETETQRQFRAECRASIPILRDLGDVLAWEKGL